MSLDQWKIRANRLLSETFGIDFIDAGLGDEELRSAYAIFDNPADWVSHFGAKYDLIEI